MSFEDFLKHYYNKYPINIIDISRVPDDVYYICRYTIELNGVIYSNMYSDYYGYKHMNFIYIDNFLHDAIDYSPSWRLAILGED